jgi:hypothetical protein
MMGRRGRRIAVRAALGLTALVLLSGCLEWDVARLASDELGGRQNGTAGAVLAQDHIIGQLDDWGPGLNTEATGRDAYLQPITGGANVVGLIPGTDPALAGEYVIVGAHYDGLGSSCKVVVAGDTVCNGATDNAAGAAAVLSIGRMLHESPPARSVVLAFWDREEDGLQGSRAYIADPLVPLAQTVTYVNFDILGANLRPSVRNDTFAVGAETGGAVLQSIVAKASRRSTLDTHPLSLVFGLGRSDHAVFAANSIPTVFLTDSTGPCYHTTSDDVAAVDFAKLEQQTQMARWLVNDLVRKPARPTFVPGTPVATYADAVQLNVVFNRAMADLATFTPAQQTQLIGFRQTIQDIVDAGPEAFTNDTMVTMLGTANSVVNLMTSGPCSSFVPEPEG